MASLSRRPTSTGIAGIIAACRDCEWRGYRNNAVGLAAQHSDRTGHEVRVEVCRFIYYRPRWGDSGAK